MRARAKQKHVASDRARRPNVPKHILYIFFERERNTEKYSFFFMKRKTETLFFGQTENLHEQGKIKGCEREGRRRNFACKLSKRRVL